MVTEYVFLLKCVSYFTFSVPDTQTVARKLWVLQHFQRKGRVGGDALWNAHE